MAELNIVLVGAGSREFGPATIRDILLSDVICAQDTEIRLMDLSAERLEEHQAYAERIAKHLGRSIKITHTTHLNQSLQDAHAVVTAIEIKRYYYWAQDFHIPRMYGFKQIYGENGGPGGLFHALRNLTPTLEIARAMEQVCPEALLLNYTNPLTKLCEGVERLTNVHTIGLCHGVFHGKQQLCKLLDIDLGDLDAYASGLNHITWFESIKNRRTGEDLYPVLRQKEEKAHWLAEWDEIALSRMLLRTFGLYPSPGANHIGEYIRWAEEFLGSQALQFFYDPVKGNPWDGGKMPTWIYNLDDHPTNMPLFPKSEDHTMVEERMEKKKQENEVIEPSGELAIPIIEGIFCGQRQELAAVNIKNTGGLVPGLEEDTVVEVPAIVDASGLHPMQMQRLPEPVLAILRNQASINRLLIEAFDQGSKSSLLQALLLDPTCHSYKQAVHLIDEMCSRQTEVVAGHELVTASDERVIPMSKSNRT